MSFLARSSLRAGATATTNYLAQRAVLQPSSVLRPQQTQIIAVRNFSKRLSKSATKRIPLSPKRAGKGYYKGNRCTKEGHLTSKGRFIVDHNKRLELIVPENLDTFKLKPYIASTVPKFPPEKRRDPTDLSKNK